MHLATIKPEALDTMKRAIIDNDLSRMSDREKLAYYVAVCESAGLNPLMQPFAYLKLQGRVILYATKTCAEQLRGLHHVSILHPLREWEKDGVLYVEATAKNGKGRTDVDRGAVPVKGLGGDKLANAHKKCVTQAKRRVTLSICGLGFLLDQTEVEQVPGEVVDLPDAMPTKQNTPSSAEAERPPGNCIEVEAKALGDKKQIKAAMKFLARELWKEMDAADSQEDQADVLSILEKWAASPYNSKICMGDAALRAIDAAGILLPTRPESPAGPAVVLRDWLMGKPPIPADGVDAESHRSLVMAHRQRWKFFITTWLLGRKFQNPPGPSFTGEGGRPKPLDAISEFERMRDGEISEGGAS